MEPSVTPPLNSASSNSESSVFFGTRFKNEAPTNKRLISKNEMKNYRDTFALFDKDGNGSITKEELGSVMRSLGQFARGKEIDEMLIESDADGDGKNLFSNRIFCNLNLLSLN